MRAALGIDIGGTKIAAGVVNSAGLVIARVEALTPSQQGGDAVLDVAIKLARSVGKGRDYIAVGVGSAGAIDAVGRRVLSATDHIVDWAGRELGAVFESGFGVPVIVENDVHAHALGEAFIGAGAGKQTVLLVAVGTGIGGALIIDGRLHRGAHSLAGHIGHLPSAEAGDLRCPCGKRGHLEGIGSGNALYELYLRRGGARSAVNSYDVIARSAVDPIARGAVTFSASALGRALGGMTNAIDPDVLIISGGMRNAGELWWSSMEAALRASALSPLHDVPVVPGLLGSDAALIGAAKQALDFVGESQ